MSNPASSPATPAASAAWRGPFAYPGFRHFFVGITFLSLGVWIGDPAMRWLVQELTHSPFWVGVIGFCSSFPILVFSLPGGVLADRVNRVLLFSLGRGTGALLTLLLATGVVLQVVTVAHVAVYAVLIGALVAIEIPGRQAILPNLVPRHSLMGAVAVSSGVWSSSLMIGPAIAGWIISSFGIAACFYTAATMHIIAVAIFLGMRDVTASASARPTESPWASLVSGLVYIRHHTVIFGLILVTVVVTVLGQPAIQTLLPSYAANVLNGGPDIYGLMLTALGLGSALANVGLAVRQGWRRRGRMVVYVSAALACTSLALSAAGTIALAFPIAMLMGVMQATLLTLTSTLVQATVDEAMRGRVLSAYMLTWGMTSAGSLFFGSLAGWVGVPPAMAVAGVLLLAATAVIRARMPQVWALE